MAIDKNYRILRSVLDDSTHVNNKITTDFKIASDFLKASDVLGVLVNDIDSEDAPKFTSTDGVIPLSGETAEDIGLLVKWLTRAKGCEVFDLSGVDGRFHIDVDNIETLLRLSDKYDIESLRREINSSYTLWILRERLTPTYDLWETAARFGLDDVEESCRVSAREQIKKVIEEGEGLQYFLRELYVLRPRNAVMRPQDAVLQQMYAAQL